MSRSELRSETAAIRLYFYPGTRAIRARWMLEELGVSYDMSVVDLKKAEHKQSAYLVIHPLGKVPALQIDGTVIFESLAICLYLADRYWDRDLAPVVEERVQRAAYLAWMAFSTGTMEPAIVEMDRLRKSRKKGLATVNLGPSLTPFETAAGYIEATLSDRPFLLGEQFSVADLMNGSVMMRAQGMGLLEGYGKTIDWLARLKRRAAFDRANAILR